MTHSDRTDEETGHPSGQTSRAMPVLGIVLAAGLVLIVAVAAFLFFFPSPVSRFESHPAVGGKLAQLELQPLDGDGEPLTLDRLAGEVVVLNFWGTWCPPCRKELPDIAAIEKKYRNRNDFKLLAVSCGYQQPEDVEALRWDTTALLDQMQIDMPTYVDPGGVTRNAVDEVIGLDAYPTTIVMDRAGVIRGVVEQRVSETELETLVHRLLNE